MKNIDPKATPERRKALKSICEPESFIDIVTECVDPIQAKAMRPYHMANFLALAAELFLINYDGIAAAFERANGLEVTFKLKLAPEKDNVELQYKPVDTYKDSASAPLPVEDPEQPEFPEMKKCNPDPAPTPPAPPAGAPLGLPSPEVAALGLPAPEVADDSPLVAAYKAGMKAYKLGQPRSKNPYPAKSDLRKCWSNGWADGSKIDMKSLDAEVVEDQPPTGGGVEILESEEYDTDPSKDF